MKTLFRSEPPSTRARCRRAHTIALALGLPIACRPGNSAGALPTGAPIHGTARPPAFEVIVLGASGGLVEQDLSCYLVAAAGTPAYVALDAGTLYSGLARAHRAGTLPVEPVEPVDPVDPSDPASRGGPGNSTSKLSAEGQFLREKIRAYLITHAHLDHYAGLVLDSPEDGRQPVFGLATTLDPLRANIFNGTVWANFTDRGPGELGKHPFITLEPGVPIAIPTTTLTVEAATLSHGPAMTSTAFLVRHGGAALLYLGDTGADEIEGSDRLAQLWRRVGPLVRDGRLHALFMEASFPDARPKDLLFGHLTPRLFFSELHALAAEVDPAQPATALRGLPVVVTHRKPTLSAGRPAASQIADELRARNDLGVDLIFPAQGMRLAL